MMNDSAVIRDHSSATIPWTSTEIARLRELAPLGAVVAAHTLGRSLESVRMQAKRQRISLRPPGRRGGRILGQIRGVSVSRRLRSDVESGRLSNTRVVELVSLAAAGAPICPMCGREPIETPAGLGVICHNRELAHAHELVVDQLASQRELDAARQRKHRAKGVS